MDMYEIRTEALRRASEDCRNGTLQEAPETVVTRARSYLNFLMGVPAVMTGKQRPARRKRER